MGMSRVSALVKAAGVSGIAAVALTTLTACGGSNGSEYSTVNAVIAALNAGGVPCVDPAPFGEIVPGSQTITCHGSDMPDGGLDQLGWQIRIYFVNVITDQAGKDALAADAAKCQKGAGGGTNTVVQGANWRISGDFSSLPLVQPQAIADALKGTILNCPDSTAASSTDAPTQTAEEPAVSIGLALEDSEAAGVLASDPGTRPEVLNQLFEHYKGGYANELDLSVIGAIAANPSATAELLADVDSEMRQNDMFSSLQGVDFAMCGVYKAIAQNPNTPITLLSELATSADFPTCQAPALARKALTTRGT